MRLLSTTTYRVSMADVDAAGVIYYASPYRWSEMLFTDWLAETGHAISQMLKTGRGSPCVASSAQYFSPVRLDDVVRLELRAGHVGKTSFQVIMDVVGPAGPAVRTDSTFVMTETKRDAMCPVALPSSLRKRLLHEPL